MTDPIAFTDSSARFKLPFLFAGQAQKEFFVNEAHALTDMLLHTAVIGERASPPSESADGDIWIVANGADGQWAGYDNYLAGQQGGVWKFIPPVVGMRVFDQSSGQFTVYSDSWIRPNAPVTPDSGATVDSDMRAAFGLLIQALRNAGIFSATE